LTRDHDGTTLEQVIGELQSEHGVPQHPQEYRITLKVAEDRSERSAEEAPGTQTAEDPAAATSDGERRKREKAPAAPRMGSSGADGDDATSQKSSRRRRSRRRRRKPKSSGGP
ncbi:MAG: hypothetical protein M3174_02545, partial [Actinomycetota bacterium]|nr:hypothetical protein [Actinomycetota bacterium]